MTICQTRKEGRPQSRNQLDSAAKSAPSGYNHHSGDMGVVLRTDVSDDGFSTISVASPSTAPPFSYVAPPSVCDPGLTRPFGLYRGVVVDERVYYRTEKHDNGELDLEAAIYDYDIDVLRKTKHARFLLYPERTGRNQEIQEKNSSVTGEPNTCVYNDDDDGKALLCAKNNERCRNALLDSTAAEHVPWEGLGEGHHGPVVITYGMVSVSSTTPSMRFPHGGPCGAHRGR